MISCLWYPPGDQWDQTMLRDLLDGMGLNHVTCLRGGRGSAEAGVVVIPARYYEPDTVNTIIKGFNRVVLILSSDEESTFDHTALKHPDMKLWVMTPRVGQHDPADVSGFLGEGYGPGTRQVLAAMELPTRSLDWAFRGQGGHRRREELFDVMACIPNGDGEQTPGFTKGLPREQYMALLASAMCAPAPSGPATPDSFRAFEALEAGTVPILDGTCSTPNYPKGYWDLLLGDHPFPVAYDWRGLGAHIAEQRRLGGWANVRALAWWLGYKRDLVRRLRADIHPSRIDRLTVLISSSPVSSHPSLDMLADTVGSVRHWLPDVEILVMCDGVHETQRDMSGRYLNYLHQLTWKCAHDEQWARVTPIVSLEHLHQASMTRLALRKVDSQAILFMEHDTPLVTDEDIPFDELIDVIEAGEANLIRFHHEAAILKPHRYLMLDAEPRYVHSQPLLRTAQWSQRPHLASTAYYRQILDTFFGSEGRSFIEDVMHGVVGNAYHRYGPPGWALHSVWMYAPEGNMKRSLHTDGRDGEDKVPQLIAYDGTPPEGAPAPGEWI